MGRQLASRVSRPEFPGGRPWPTTSFRRSPT